MQLVRNRELVKHWIFLKTGIFFLRFLNDTGPHAAYVFEPSMKAMEIQDNIPRRAQRNANSVI